MSTTLDLPQAPAHTKRLRTVLTALAGVETAYGLLHSARLLPDSQPHIALDNLAGQITAAGLILAPILAFAALVFAIWGKLPQAIIALAAVVLATCAGDLKSEEYNLALVVLDVVRPFIAALAIVLAVRRIRLGLAAILVASMWLLWAWITVFYEVFLFTFAVFLYGV